MLLFKQRTSLAKVASKNLALVQRVRPFRSWPFANTGADFKHAVLSELTTVVVLVVPGYDTSSRGKKNVLFSGYRSVLHFAVLQTGTA